MLYNYYPLKSIEDYEELYNEINAWIQMENEEFDFGDGLMRIEGWYGSENAYYKMDLESLEEYLEELDQKNKSLSESYNYNGNDEDYSHSSLIKDYWETQLFCNNKYPLHKSHYKKREKEHLENLYTVNFWSVRWSKTDWESNEGSFEKVTDGYLKKCYAPRRAKYYRKLSNKKVRKYKKGIKHGGMYRRVFDYWWALY